MAKRFLAFFTLLFCFTSVQAETLLQAVEATTSGTISDEKSELTDWFSTTPAMGSLPLSNKTVTDDAITGTTTLFGNSYDLALFAADGNDEMVIALVATGTVHLDEWLGIDSVSAFRDLRGKKPVIVLSRGETTLEYKSSNVKNAPDNVKAALKNAMGAAQSTDWVLKPGLNIATTIGTGKSQVGVLKSNLTSLGMTVNPHISVRAALGADNALTNLLSGEAVTGNLDLVAVLPSVKPMIHGEELPKSNNTLTVSFAEAMSLNLTTQSQANKNWINPFGTTGIKLTDTSASLNVGVQVQGSIFAQGTATDPFGLDNFSVDLSALLTVSSSSVEGSIGGDKDRWTNPFGLRGLTLNDLAFNLDISDSPGGTLTGTVTLDGKPLQVSASFSTDEQEGGAMVTIKHAGDDTFNPHSIDVLENIPGIDTVAFKQLVIANNGMSATVVFNSGDVSAAVVFPDVATKTDATGAALVIKIPSYDLENISPLIPAPIKDLTFSESLFVFSDGIDTLTGDGVLTDFMTGLANAAGMSDVNLDIEDGVSLFGAIDTSTIPGGSELGLSSGTALIGGRISDYTGATPKFAFYAEIPGLSIPSGEQPEFLTGIGSPKLLLKVDTSEPITGTVGLGMDMTLQYTQSDSMTVGMEVLAGSDGTLTFATSMDEWKDAFGSPMDLTNVAIAAGGRGAEASMSVMGTLSVSSKSYSLKGHAAFAGGVVPSGAIFEFEADTMGLTDLLKIAEAATGAKSLKNKMKINQLPTIDLVSYKPEGSNTTVPAKISIATPGVSSPVLGMNGPSVEIKGKLKAMKTDIAIVDLAASATSLQGSGNTLINEIGPISLQDSSVSLNASTTAIPSFKLIGGAGSEVIGYSKSVEVELSKSKVKFSFDDELAGVGATHFSAETTGSNLANISAFTVTGSIDNSAMSGLGTAFASGFDMAHQALTSEFNSWRTELEADNQAIADATTDYNEALAAASAELEDAESAINEAQAEVNSLTTDINSLNTQIRNLNSFLENEDNHWDVIAMIDKAATLATKEGERLILIASRDTANAILDAAEDAVSAVPVELHPAVLAAKLALDAVNTGVLVAGAAVTALEETSLALNNSATLAADILAGAENLINIDNARFTASSTAFTSNTPIALSFDVTFDGTKTSHTTNIYPGAAVNFADNIVDNAAALIAGVTTAGADTVSSERDTRMASLGVTVPDVELHYYKTFKRSTYGADKTNVVFTNKKKSQLMDLASNKKVGSEKNIKKRVSGLPDGKLSAAFYHHNNQKYYFFKGDQYWRSSDGAKVDSGYPKKIEDEWGAGGQGPLWPQVTQIDRKKERDALKPRHAALNDKLSDTKATQGQLIKALADLTAATEQYANKVATANTNFESMMAAGKSLAEASSDRDAQLAEAQRILQESKERVEEKTGDKPTLAGLEFRKRKIDRQLARLTKKQDRMETAMENAGAGRIDAVVHPGNGESVYLFVRHQVIEWKPASNQVEPARNIPLVFPDVWPEGVDAAHRFDDSTLAFYSGDQVLLWDTGQQKKKSGYPKKISSFASALPSAYKKEE